MRRVITIEGDMAGNPPVFVGLGDAIQWLIGVIVNGPTHGDLAMIPKEHIGDTFHWVITDAPPAAAEPCAECARLRGERNEWELYLRLAVDYVLYRRDHGGSRNLESIRIGQSSEPGDLCLALGAHDEQRESEAHDLRRKLEKAQAECERLREMVDIAEASRADLLAKHDGLRRRLAEADGERERLRSDNVALRDRLMDVARKREEIRRQLAEAEAALAGVEAERDGLMMSEAEMAGQLVRIQDILNDPGGACAILDEPADGGGEE